MVTKATITLLLLEVSVGVDERSLQCKLAGWSTGPVLEKF